MPLPFRPGQFTPAAALINPVSAPSPSRAEAVTHVTILPPVTPPPPPPTTVHIPDCLCTADLNVLVEEPASFPTPTVRPANAPPTDVPAVDFLERGSSIPGTFEPDEEPFFRNLDLERGLGDLNFERDFAQWFNPVANEKPSPVAAPQATVEDPIVAASAKPIVEPQVVHTSPVMSERSVQPVSSPTPEPPLRATFISDNNISDGHLLPPGAEFVKSWKMLNDGVRDWPETTQLVFVAGDKLVSDENTKVKVGKVTAGEEIDIWTGDMKVRPLFVSSAVCVAHSLQAPDVPGKYVSYWRLNDGNGNHFGHSLWAEYVTLSLSFQT